VDHPVGGAAGEPLVALIALILDSAAPTAAKEIAELNKIAAGKKKPEDYVQTAEQQRQIVQMALERFLSPNGKIALGRSRAKFNIPLRTRRAFVDDLKRRTKLSVRQKGLSEPDDLAGLAAKLVLGGEDLLQFFPWALKFTNYRFEILRQLSELSSEAAAELSLYVPAVIDYNKWLIGPDDPFPADVTPMVEQAAVMSKISAMKGRKFAMHGYVAFDPWRQAIYQRDTGIRELDPTIKAAVCEQGFIGVKLYPPMGFRPIGNGDPDLKPSTLHFPCNLTAELGPNCGDLLDDALIVLYDWCVAEDVPIMAHCGYSNYARQDFAERAHPAYWQRVFEYSDMRSRPYGDLRLNLGHVGGITEYAEDKPGCDWLSHALAMINSRRYANLYADFAYDSLVLERNDEEISRDSKAMCFLQSNLNGAAGINKIMYGSDWIMLGLEYGSERYYPALKNRFSKIFDSDDLSKFLKLNAANYLGLSLRNGEKLKPRQRLEKFYQTNGLDISILDVFL
jgi:predicted TIM-barrel fold metal-dependent hydrolase